MIPPIMASDYIGKELSLDWRWLEEDDSGMAMYGNWKIIWVRDRTLGVKYTAHDGYHEISGDVRDLLYRIDYGLL